MDKRVCTRFDAPAAHAIAVCCVLLLLATGCGSRQATPTPVRTVQPSGLAAAKASATPIPSDTPAPTATPLPTATPAPTATPDPYARAQNIDPLTGLPVSDPAVLARRPLLVAIGNDQPARQVHYGFAQADLVYEYLMEGRGITRFTAVFLANEVDRIGPLRSARLVNLYLTPQYNGAMVASGASGEVNWFLTFKMGQPYLNTDLDDPSNSVYSWSIGSSWMTRMQTSTARLRKWLSDKQADADPKLRGFAFAEPAASGDPGTSASISYPSPVSWSYDSSGKRYLRTMDGVAHKDAKSGQQLGAANVIIQTVSHEATTYVEDTLGNTSIRIITAGEGAVTILRDGVAIKGTWKAGDKSMPEFFGADGKVIPLRPGNTWFELVEATTKVAIK